MVISYNKILASKNVSVLVFNKIMAKWFQLNTIGYDL